MLGVPFPTPFKKKKRKPHSISSELPFSDKFWVLGHPQSQENISVGITDSNAH